MKTRKRKVFERVVNPLIIKHLVSAHGYDGRCIASGIPIKYLSYFKEVSGQKNAEKNPYKSTTFNFFCAIFVLFSQFLQFCNKKYAIRVQMVA